MPVFSSEERGEGRRRPTSKAARSRSAENVLPVDGREKPFAGQVDEAERREGSRECSSWRAVRKAATVGPEGSVWEGGMEARDDARAEGESEVEEKGQPSLKAGQGDVRGERRED